MKGKIKILPGKVTLSLNFREFKRYLIKSLKFTEGKNDKNWILGKIKV